MFAERLKLLRLEAGLTQKDIAKRFNTSQQNYAHWESGRKPTAETLEKFAKFFDVSVDYLLGNTDDKHSDERNLSDVEILFRKSSENLTKEQQETFKKELEEFMKMRTEHFKNLKNKE